MRHLYHFQRNLDRWSDAVYWPVMDLILWGLTTRWLQSSNQGASNLLLVMLTGIVFWQIVWRANYEISVNLLEETWSRNVVNLFATPLTLCEWIAGLMTVGILKVALGMTVGLLASWLLYSLNILSVGYLLLPFLASLVMFGWCLGFFAAGLILRFGRNVQTVAWMMGWLLAPLSAVYYPVAALPHWAQPLAYAIPTTYIFEGMRQVLAGGVMSYGMLGASFALNILYLAAMLYFFASMFEVRRGMGLQGLD
jgi:ABC-2 type transport system permease protein